ncbi:unnamed protein product [Brassica oleracea var. botrytis]
MGMVCKSYASAEDLKKISMAIAVAIIGVGVGVRKSMAVAVAFLVTYKFTVSFRKFSFFHNSLKFSLFFCEFLILMG